MEFNLKNIKDLAQYDSIEGKICKGIIEQSDDEQELKDTLEMVLEGENTIIENTVVYLTDNEIKSLVNEGIMLEEEYNLCYSMDELLKIIIIEIVSSIVYD